MDKDKFFSFLEKWLIRLIIISTGSILIINTIILTLTNNKFGLISLSNFLQGPLINAIFDTQATLLTIAAIFVGFYFTVFTLLGSIKVDSVFANLTHSNFERLVGYIRQAFIASFIFIFISLLNAVLIKVGVTIPIIYVIFNLLAVLYMFLTSFRFGVMIYVAYGEDLKRTTDIIRDERRNKNRYDLIMKRLDVYLNDYENNKHKLQAEKIGKTIEERNAQNKQ